MRMDSTRLYSSEQWLFDLRLAVARLSGHDDILCSQSQEAQCARRLVQAVVTEMEDIHAFIAHIAEEA